MNDWVVETSSFEEDLMNNRVVMLNQNGVNKVVEIIKEKDKEIKRLNDIINESAEEILKELEKNHHLSYGVALAIRQKLLDYKELKGSAVN